MILSEILDLIRTYINDPTGDKLFKEPLTRFVNQGIKDFCEQTGIYEFTNTQTSVASTKEVSLTFADGSEINKVYFVSFNNSQISPITLKYLLFGDFESATENTPTNFSDEKTGEIILYPTPATADASKTIRIYGAGTPATADYFVATVTSGTSPLDSRWDMALIYYAAGQSLAALGEGKRSSYFLQLYQTKVKDGIKSRSKKIRYKYTKYPSRGLKQKEIIE